MPTNKLHPAQKKLIDLLAKNVSDPLTIRELQEAIGASSTSVVAHHINQLEKKGHLKRNHSDPRDYVVVGFEPENPIAYINLFGLAQCGPKGSLLDGNPLDKIPLSSRLINFPISEAFIVKARGDSMTPRINDGDLVIARRSDQKINGSMVVCVNNGEALIKKIFVDSENILLVSLNNEYHPFSASRDFHIEGIVKGVISTNTVGY